MTNRLGNDLHTGKPVSMNRQDGPLFFREMRLEHHRFVRPTTSIETFGKTLKIVFTQVDLSAEF